MGGTQAIHGTESPPPRTRGKGGHEGGGGGLAQGLGGWLC